MSRKRIGSLAALAVVALVAAGAAVAAHRAQSSGAASATFVATTVSHSSSRSCTGADGTYVDTSATYTGTASSADARLAGPLEIRAHSIVNTTTGLGFVQGSFRVHDADGDVHGNLTAALSGTNVVGSVTGNVGRPQAKLVASLAGTFAAGTGFASGSLGTGTATGAGLVFQHGDCRRVAPPKPVHSVEVAHLDFRGVKRTHANGTLTLDLTRDSTGAITGATAVFYVNYHFGSSVTINGLAVRTSGGAVELDSGTTAFTDADGSGNLTKTVGGVSAAVAQALVSAPRTFDVELATSAGTLKADLRPFARRG